MALENDEPLIEPDLVDGCLMAYLYVGEASKSHQQQHSEHLTRGRNSKLAPYRR